MDFWRCPRCKRVPGIPIVDQARIWKVGRNDRPASSIEGAIKVGAVPITVLVPEIWDGDQTSDGAKDDQKGNKDQQEEDIDL
jgi:hypothetical protein